MSIPYKPEIDGLRAIAVLAVVAYHAGFGPPAGYAGVDIFLVISGYLITRILQQQIADTGRVSYRDFYARRIRRIYPALVTVAATTIALSALLGPDGRQRVLASALASLGMMGNFHFQTVTGGYFDATSEQMPLLHLWSLGVEEQFYLVWPLVLAMIFRRWRAALLVIAAASFGLAEWWLRVNPEAAFYQMPARAWELAGGAWLAMRPLPATPPRWMGYAGLALLMIGVFVPPPAAHFPGLGAISAVAGAMLIIQAVRDEGSPVNRLLASRPFVYVGLISYSLYLWHWPLLAIYRAISLEMPIRTAVGLCLVAGGLAALTYRHIETPLRRADHPRQRFAAAVLCFACMGALLPSLPFLQRAPTPTEATLVIEKAERPCTTPSGYTQPLREGCRPEDADVVLWGDSHASAWRPFADALGTVADFSMTSCMPFVGWDSEVDRTARHHSHCTAHNKAAAGFMSRGARTVLIAAYFRKKPHVIRYFAKAIDEIAPHAKRVLVILPTPYLRGDAAACIQFSLDCAMRRSDYDDYARSIRLQLTRVARRHKNVELIDVADFFCDEFECPVVRFGYPLYMDDHHITTRAAREFATEYLRSTNARHVETVPDPVVQ